MENKGHRKARCRGRRYISEVEIKSGAAALMERVMDRFSIPMSRPGPSERRRLFAGHALFGKLPPDDLDALLLRTAHTWEHSENHPW